MADCEKRGIKTVIGASFAMGPLTNPSAPGSRTPMDPSQTKWPLGP